MGRKHSSRNPQRPQSSKRDRNPIPIGLVTPWHEAGIETLTAYSRTVDRDREGWR